MLIETKRSSRRRGEPTNCNAFSASRCLGPKPHCSQGTTTVTRDIPPFAVPSGAAKISLSSPTGNTRPATFLLSSTLTRMLFLISRMSYVYVRGSTVSIQCVTNDIDVDYSMNVYHD